MANRPTKRPTIRRLRAEILCGPYGQTDYVEIKAGRFAGAMTDRGRLAELIGVRVPARGRFRLVVATAAKGSHECYGFRRGGILRVRRQGDVWGPMFCWLPRAFRGCRVRLTVKPSTVGRAGRHVRGA